jgi:excinuclease UvrABC ATPase subunit
MVTHKGKPSGSNKPGNKGTGIPSDFKPEKLKSDKKITGKYTKNEEKISEAVKARHPNRNVNKLHATNAGGYKM